MFFQTITGSLLPISKIERITPQMEAGSEKGAKVEMVDTGTVTVAQHVLNPLRDLPSSGFAAQPNTYLIFGKAEEDMATFVPVIGWEVPMYGPAVPITADGRGDGVSNTYCVLHPDGS